MVWCLHVILHDKVDSWSLKHACDHVHTRFWNWMNAFALSIAAGNRTDRGQDAINWPWPSIKEFSQGKNERFATPLFSLSSFLFSTRSSSLNAGFMNWCCICTTFKIMIELLNFTLPYVCLGQLCVLLCKPGLTWDYSRFRSQSCPHCKFSSSSWLCKMAWEFGQTDSHASKMHIRLAPFKESSGEFGYQDTSYP